jgi:hypothetical protein
LNKRKESKLTTIPILSDYNGGSSFSKSKVPHRSFFNVGSTVKKTLKYGEIVVGENIRQEAIRSNYLASLSSNNPEKAQERDKMLSLYSRVQYIEPTGKRSTMSRG